MGCPFIYTVNERVSQCVAIFSVCQLRQHIHTEAHNDNIHNVGIVSFFIHPATYRDNILLVLYNLGYHLDPQGGLIQNILKGGGVLEKCLTICHAVNVKLKVDSKRGREGPDP